MAQVERHLAGTTYHKCYVKSGGQWIQNWKAYWECYSGQPLPHYCPGSANEGHGGTGKAHPLGDSPVGAHCLIVGEDGECYFGIVPCCKMCNNWHNEYPLVWECTAVSVVRLSSLSFTGQIRLAEEVGGGGDAAGDAAGGNSAKQKMSSDYWSHITSIRVQDPDGAGTSSRRKGRVTIEGTTNKGVKDSCTYSDPDDFLSFLALLMRGNLMRPADRKRSKTRDFKPQVILCNKGRRPLKGSYNGDEVVPAAGGKPAGGGAPPIERKGSGTCPHCNSTKHKTNRAKACGCYGGCIEGVCQLLEAEDVCRPVPAPPPPQLSSSPLPKTPKAKAKPKKAAATRCGHCGSTGHKTSRAKACLCHGGCNEATCLAAG